MEDGISNFSQYDNDEYGFLLTPIKVPALGCTVWIETKGDIDTDRIPVVRFRPADKKLPLDTWPSFTLDGEPLRNCEPLSVECIRERKDWILQHRILLLKHWEGLIDSADLVRGI